MAAPGERSGETPGRSSSPLAEEWRALRRAATIVAIITSPALYVLFHNTYSWPIIWCIVAALAGVVIFRGLIDVLAHRFIPSPSLYGAEEELKQADITTRRRV